jgi:hypothetical protein
MTERERPSIGREKAICDRCLQGYPIAPPLSTVVEGRLYQPSDFPGNTAAAAAFAGSHAGYLCGRCYLIVTDRENRGLWP